MAIGDLVPRAYSSFRGVDFRGEEVNLVRSPDSLNVWKDYKEIESIRTRPEMELQESFDTTIYGVFFYKVGNTEMQIVHSGTTLYKIVNGVRETLYTGLAPRRSAAFIYNNIWYFKDGINYLQYNGETIGEVVGYAPTTTIARKPSGGGTKYEDINMLTGIRINTFLADGESREYNLDAQGIDADFQPIVAVNDIVVENYTVDTTNGRIIFNEAPAAPLTDGQDNVSIKFRKTVAGHRNRINNCTLLQVFDNRVFFSGNQDYPNVIWHCSLNDPTYCSDLDYYNEGLDLSAVTGLVAGNNALWVFKEPSQANTAVFYHNPTIDSEYGKIYPSTHSSISTGCIGAAINFNDDIAFFSDRGMEAINGDVTTEQVIAHRSSLVDRKLLAEANYKDMLLEEWEGYLMVFVDNKVYLADSRGTFTNENHMEYEWFYWELGEEITCTKVYEGTLYLGTKKGIYTLTATDNDYADYKKVVFTEENGRYTLHGESKQPTTNGHQLFDSSKLPTISKGGATVKNNGDGSFSVSGSGASSESFEVRYFIDHNEFVKLFKEGTLYLKNEKQTYPFMYVNLYKNGVFSQTILTNKWSARTSFEITQEHLDGDYSLYIGFNGAADGTEIMSGTIKPMLYQDGNGEWEAFTGGVASPNVEYPSEFINTYKAGKYKTSINGRCYRFTLTEDLRSVNGVSDELYLDGTEMYLTRNVAVLNGYNGEAITTDYISSTGELSEGASVFYVSDAITNEIEYATNPVSYWTTPIDKFKNPQYQKTTNKRGCIVEATGDITVSVKTDKTEWEEVGTYTNITDYFTSRIKRKKFKDIQLRFYSDTRFSLESAILECYVGGYIKR